MKIVDNKGRRTEGACQFMYRGYVISCTTIGGLDEIGVISPSGVLDPTSWAPNTDGFRMAMTYIDVLVSNELAKSS